MRVTTKATRAVTIHGGEPFEEVSHAQPLLCGADSGTHLPLASQM
jgi:hypothetical protein